MYKLVGVNSEKVYAKGSSKADCLRKLQTKYPYFTKRSDGRKTSKQQLYPEALILVRND